MKSKFSVLRSKGVALKTAIGAALLSSSVATYAALPDWATGSGAQVQTAAEDAAAEFGPAIIAGIVLLIIIRWIKRIGNKV